MNNQDLMLFYGSLSISSNLMNCVITSERNNDGAQITVDEGNIIIRTKTYTKKLKFQDLKLFPETCRGLKYSSTKELKFSIKVESKTGELEPVLPAYSSQSDTVDQIKLEQNRWFCDTCKQKIVSDGCIFSRVLPLPAENWLDFSDMWFCHDHGDGDKKKPGGALLPKQRECFVGETFVLVDKHHLSTGAVKISGEGAVVCCRCGRQLGSLVDSDTDKVKLFLHTITFGAPVAPEKEDMGTTVSINREGQAEELFARLFLEQSQLYTSYRFIVETKCPSEHSTSSSTSTPSGETSTCLVWLLDGNGRMYRSCPSQGTEVVQQESAVSALFKCQLKSEHSKPDPINNALISLWRKDNTVHGIMLPHPVFLQLVSTLVQNCRVLPRSQRYANGFNVSFLRRADVSR